MSIRDIAICTCVSYFRDVFFVVWLFILVVCSKKQRNMLFAILTRYCSNRFLIRNYSINELAAILF